MAVQSLFDRPRSLFKPRLRYFQACRRCQQPRSSCTPLLVDVVHRKPFINTDVQQLDYVLTFTRIIFRPKLLSFYSYKLL